MQSEAAVRLKQLNHDIYKSAESKVFFRELVSEAQAKIEGEPQNVVDILGGMLGTAIWHLAFDEPYAVWKRQAEVALICLGHYKLNLKKFFKRIQDDCQGEIEASYFADTTFKMGVDIGVIEKEVRRILKGAGKHSPAR